MNSRIACSLIAFVAIASTNPARAQQGGASRAGYNPPPTYADVPGRPAVVMPNAAQLAAINSLNAAVADRVQAAAGARDALQSAFVSNPAGIRPLADALGAAELELATARAVELARIQATLTPRLTPFQVSLIPNIALAGPVPAGRGGGNAVLPANPNDVIQTLANFRTEVVVAANRAIQGSWISIAEDDQGRILLGANDGQPFTRITVNGSGQVTRNEVIYTPLSEVMGLTWIGNSMYAAAGRQPNLVTGKLNPGNGANSLAGDMGLHRVSDPAGDGSFSKVETLHFFQGGEAGHGDHGIHGVRASPDGRHLYMINGNNVFYPPSISPNSPVRNNRDDRIIPLLGGGGGRGGAAPADPNAPAPVLTGGGRGQGAIATALGRNGMGGWIARMDLNGQDFHLFVAGLRNPLHYDFNADGEIFIYDSDHEPERGVPWYTPTRVLWAPSGANFGHRMTGSGKYPGWWEDAVPSLYDVGLGSPVGVSFGYNAKFPAAYQKALYIADNNYGRIMALHIKPLQSGYTVTGMDYFVYPKSLLGDAPLTVHNITDMLVARDGTFYYVVGNRSTQSYLMRVVYTGPLSTQKVPYVNTEYAAERKQRRDLEAFHWTINDPRAVNAAWPHLGSDDRPLRYAARVALETVPPAAWKARALAEADPATAIQAMLALARVGGAESHEDVLRTLAKFPLTSLSDDLRVQKMRVIGVAISRNGKPSDAASAQIVADVDSVFPGKTFEQNTEASQILAYFNAPTAVPKTMALIARSTVYQENAAYRYNIRFVPNGWTPETRRTYFRWFNENHANDTFVEGYREWAARVGQAPTLAGNNFDGIRTNAMATLTEQERADPELAAILAGGGGRGGPVPAANPFGPALPAPGGRGGL